MSTLQQISYWAKTINPFLASGFSLLVAYGDQYRGWKLLGALLTALYFLAVGGFGLFAH